MKKFFFVLLIAITSLSFDSSAQCAMCRRVAETSHDAKDNNAGYGLNSGIMYLLSIPYVLAGIGFYAYFKKGKKR